jgi:hypothetical protein
MNTEALISLGVVGAKDSWEKKGRFLPFRHDDIRLSQRLDRRANEPTPRPANLPVIIKQSETAALLNIFTRAKPPGRLLREH